MSWRSFEVEVRAIGPYCEMDSDEFEEALEDMSASVKRDGDDLMLTYEANGNVDAIQHSRSFLDDLQDLDLEADEIRLTARPSENQ